MVALQISGGHWTVLQSVAWVGMVVSYTQTDDSLASAVEKTFDGQHPCDLCEVVKDGRNADREQDVQKTLVKLDGVLVEQRALPLPRVMATDYDESAPSEWAALQAGVPTPPPRRA